MSTADTKATTSWHSLRKRVHLVCCLLFVVLPFLNVVRFDLPRQRFYFAGYELWISEFGILFSALMFLLFVVVALSVFYGRVYCGYLCPQMIFSEASIALEQRIQKWVTKRYISSKPHTRTLIRHSIFYSIVAVASVFLAFVFISYFVEPRDLLGRLASLDLRTAGGIAGATVTLITFLDFALLRQRFCTTVCPYGYLQGILGDGNTLLVHYRDEQHDCIECRKCVRVCQMGIDIRKSPFQIECVHCGECIDACEEVLVRLKKPGLIHYAWGEHGATLASNEGSWLRRIGIRDAKRVVVLLVLSFYMGGLVLALAMRHNVLVKVNPDRGQKLYRVEGGRVLNTFQYEVANRGGKPDAVVFSIHELPAGMLRIVHNPIPLKPGEVARGEFEVALPAARATELVSHFTIDAATVQSRETIAIPMTFLSPPEKKHP